MEINIINQSEETIWEDYASRFEAIAKRAESILKLAEDFSMSVIFVTPHAIHEINRDYRKIDRPTDVISFALQDDAEAYEMMGEEKELGDVFINVQAIRDQAKEYGHSIERECCFLFTHGLLHLLGYDHMEEAQEKAMFRLQDVILDEIVRK